MFKQSEIEDNMDEAMFDYDEFNYDSAILVVDEQIVKFLDDVGLLWINVVQNYRENPYYGFIVDGLNSKAQFYDMMLTCPTYKFLLAVKKKLLSKKRTR